MGGHRLDLHLPHDIFHVLGRWHKNLRGGESTAANARLGHQPRLWKQLGDELSSRSDDTGLAGKE